MRGRGLFLFSERSEHAHSSLTFIMILPTYKTYGQYRARLKPFSEVVYDLTHTSIHNIKDLTREINYNMLERVFKV